MSLVELRNGQSSEKQSGSTSLPVLDNLAWLSIFLLGSLNNKEVVVSKKTKIIIVAVVVVLLLAVIVLANGDAAKEGFNAGLNGN